jgi:hypothetical protein
VSSLQENSKKQTQPLQLASPDWEQHILSILHTSVEKLLYTEHGLAKYYQVNRFSQEKSVAATETADTGWDIIAPLTKMKYECKV